MKSLFIKICRVFSLSEVHNYLVDEYLSEIYRKVTAPVLILILIILIGKDYIWYVYTAPLVILSIYYSYSDVIMLTEIPVESDIEDDLIEAEDDEADDCELYADSDPKECTSSKTNISYGAIYAYLCLNYPHIKFNLTTNEHEISRASVEIYVQPEKTSIYVSSENNNYQFILVDNQINEYDKKILDIFFEKTGIKEFDVMLDERT